VNLPVTFLNAATVTNSGSRPMSFQKTITTTASPLRFIGAGGATQPAISLFFSGPLLGPAQVRVEGNVLLDVAASITWTGGSVVEHGTLDGPHGCALGGLTVGLGIQTAVATLGGPNRTLTSPIVVNPLGSLRLGFCTVDALTLNSGTFTSTSAQTFGGILSLIGNSTFTGEDLVIAGDVFLNETSVLTARDVDFSGGTRTVRVSPGASFTAATLGDEFLTDQHVVFNGGGTLHVTSKLYTDSLEIARCTFRQDGGLATTPNSKGSVLLNNGRLTGTGRVKAIGVSTVGGIIAPGASPGLLESSDGSTVLNAASALQIEINGPLPGSGYDRLISSFPDLQNATLQTTLAPSYTPLVGQEFVLVQNLRALGQPFGSGFSGIAEGTTAVLAPGITVRYSYLGGDGNDFSATVTTSPAGAFRTWDGGGADANWMTAANWVGDVLPLAGESLLFPAGAAQLTNTNNFPFGTVFHSLRLTTACTLATNNLILTGDLTASLAGAATVSSLQFRTEANPSHEILLDGSGSLAITGAIAMGDHVQLTLRRADPAGTLPALLVAGMSNDSVNIPAVINVDGGGRVHFTNGFRAYAGGTHVRHGTLQIIGGAIPGDVAIGGGAGPAVVENPGASDASGGRLADNASLTLLPGGTHLMTGATPLERISRVIYAGGQLIQPAGGRLRVFHNVEVAPGIDATINTPTIFDFPSADTTDLFHVGAGAVARVTSTISADSFQSFVMEKTGPGPLLISGGSISGTELRITEGLVAALGSAVTSISMPVSLRGGTLGGNGRISQSLSGTAAGGSVAPGGGVDGRGPGTLTIGDNFLPAPQTTVEIELSGAQNDQLVVGGVTIDLNNSTLLLSRLNGFTPTPGQTFTILNKASSGAITRTFGGKPQGSTFTAAGFTWSITYLGGDGNDVVLTAGAPAVAVDLQFTALTIGPPDGGGAGQRLQATLSGGPGAANATVLLQFSDNLQTWTTLTNSTANATGNAAFDTIDPLAGTRRFYRAIVP
jgi:fibronectin-binding autotransporter adhesin